MSEWNSKSVESALLRGPDMVGLLMGVAVGWLRRPGGRPGPMPKPEALTAARDAAQTQEPCEQTTASRGPGRRPRCLPPDLLVPSPLLCITSC